MKKQLPWLVGIIIFISTGIFSCEKKVPVQEPVELEFATAKSPKPPTNPPPNDNCENAITIIPGDTIWNQTTRNGTVQTGENTNDGRMKESVWYKFTANSSSIYADVQITANFLCESQLQTAVYNTSSCIPATSQLLGSRMMNGAVYSVLELTGLIIGNTYLVQVGYINSSTGKGGPASQCRCTYTDCKGPTFRITIDVPEPACSTCNNTCGAGCELATTPPNNDYVKNNCVGDLLVPRLVSDCNTQPCYNRTLCYSFTAAASTVNWGIVWEGGCSPVINISTLFPTWVEWEIQPSGCGGPFQTGYSTVLGDVNPVTGQFTGLTAGMQYTVCFNVVVGYPCWYNKIWPYFFGVAP
jgi:hypothetical protein